MRTILLAMGVLATVALAAALGTVYFGTYNVAADEPHWDVTTRMLAAVRDRNVARRARAVGEPPNLENPQLILKGAGEYASMCVNCHLAPGVPENQLSRGLYPEPPRLDQRRLDPREAFVIIKHGLKMTGMPSWGGDHGDEAVWGIVAFIAKMPDMSSQQYQEIVSRAPKGMHGPINAPAQPPSAEAGAHGQPGHHAPAPAASAPAAATSAPMEAPHGPPGHHGSGR